VLDGTASLQTAATPFPGDNLDLDVDDPRTAEHKPT
jgi:hypothetical protein